jgi:hypothetical protein
MIDGVPTIKNPKAAPPSKLLQVSTEGLKFIKLTTIITTASMPMNINK